MDSKGQPPPEYSPPQQPQRQGFTPQQPQQQGFSPQQPQAQQVFVQQQGFTQQQQGFTQQHVVNQSFPVYHNQGFVVQQGFPVQNQVMYTVGSPNVIVTQPTSTMIVNQRPSDYIVCSLLTCLFCFFPTGIIALVYSCMSKQASDSNDYNTGRSHGNMAKICSIVSLVMGLLWVIGLVIFLIIYFTVIVPSYYRYNNDYYNSY